MNYRLSCAADRKLGKCGFTLECGGSEVYSEVFKCVSENLKECIFEAIYRGIRASRRFVKHEDIIRIEVQNNTACQWLSGYTEHKEYTEYISKIFDVLESMDCRYIFVYEKNPYAKRYIANHKTSSIGVSSLEDAMRGLD